jgi:hypothetical protein
LVEDDVAGDRLGDVVSAALRLTRPWSLEWIAPDRDEMSVHTGTRVRIPTWTSPEAPLTVTLRRCEVPITRSPLTDHAEVDVAGAYSEAAGNRDGDGDEKGSGHR